MYKRTSKQDLKSQLLADLIAQNYKPRFIEEQWLCLLDYIGVRCLKTFEVSLDLLYETFSRNVDCTDQGNCFCLTIQRLFSSLFKRVANFFCSCLEF